MKEPILYIKKRMEENAETLIHLLPVLTSKFKDVILHRIRKFRRARSEVDVLPKVYIPPHVRYLAS